MALAYAVLTLGAFLAMEGFAWGVHRYVMHSRAGWGWHRSHHEPSRGFELNDLYAVVFAAPAVGLFALGSRPGLRWAWFLGLGVTLYGVMYALVHDGLVHRRLPLRFTPRRGYAKRLVQAHRLHHAVRTRDGAVSFGFLYAPDVRRLKAKLERGAGREGKAGVAADLASSS